MTGRRFAFCGTVPRVTPGRRYRPPCRMEPGPSSPGREARRDRPADSPGTKSTAVPADFRWGREFASYTVNAVDSRGVLTANKLPELHDHGPGNGAEPGQ